MEGTCGGYIDRGEGASGRERVEVRMEGACAQRYERPHANMHTREAVHLDGERNVRLRIAARAPRSVYNPHPREPRRRKLKLRPIDTCRWLLQRRGGVSPYPSRPGQINARLER